MPRLSYGREILWEDSGPYKIFAYLLCDQNIAVHFPKDVDLLRSKMQYITCRKDMTWSAQPNIPEGLKWRCRWKVAGAKCSESRSIKHGLWFQQSNLTFLEILHVTYDLVRREHALQFQSEYPFSLQVPSGKNAQQSSAVALFAWRYTRWSRGNACFLNGWYSARVELKTLGVSRRKAQSMHFQ